MFALLGCDTIFLKDFYCHVVFAVICLFLDSFNIEWVNQSNLYQIACMVYYFASHAITLSVSLCFLRIRILVLSVRLSLVLSSAFRSSPSTLLRSLESSRNHLLLNLQPSL